MPACLLSSIFLSIICSVMFLSVMFRLSLCLVCCCLVCCFLVSHISLISVCLQNVASSCAGGRVVGVVGQAHLDGIAEYWEQGAITDERISQITKLPGAMPASWKWQKRGLIAGSVFGSCGWMYLAYRYPGPTLCFSCVPTLPLVMYAGGAPAPEKTTQRIGLVVVCASVFGLGCWSVQRLLK